MIKKISRNDDQPIGKMKEVKDFLPPPEKLILPEENVKVTLSLTKFSIEFFKRQAKSNKTKYQKMIRELVDRYVREYHE